MGNDRFVTVAKGAINLLEGEEVSDLLNSLSAAISDVFGSGQDGGPAAYLKCTYADTVIVRDYDAGKYYQVPWSRDADGVVTLGEPVEVRETYIPVATPATKSADAGNDSSPVDIEYVHVEERGNLWAGLLQ